MDISFFVGNDYEKKSRAVDALVGSFSGSVIHLETDGVDRSELFEHILGSDLFGEERMYIIRDLGGDEGFIENLLESEPEHSVVCIDDSHSAGVKKILKKHNITPQVFEVKSERDNSLFKLTDLLLSKDIKNMWLYYHELLDRGYSPYQMHGVLWWQIKSMGFVSQQPNTILVKGFVATKSKKGVRNYPGASMNKLSSDYVSMYQKSFGEDDLRLGIEQFILNLI